MRALRFGLGIQDKGFNIFVAGQPGTGRTTAVERFLDRVQPTLVGLVELELWPNFMQACARRGIPVGVVNGRLSERSFSRYRLARPLLSALTSRPRNLPSLRHVVSGGTVLSPDIRRGLLDAIPGLTVVDVLVLVDRMQGGAKQLQAAGYCLHAILTLDELLDHYQERGFIDQVMAAEVRQYLADNQAA